MTLENLRAFPPEELRRALLGALGQIRGNTNHTLLIPYHTLLTHVGTVLGRLELLAAHKTRQLEFPGGMGKPYDEHYDNTALLSAVWSLVADGIVVPRLQSNGNNALNDGKAVIEIGYVSITPMGDALVRASLDHPRSPGGLQRLHDRHPGLADEILSRLEDAVRCIERNLARPAVVMTGLAMETTLINVERVWTTLGYVSGRPADRSVQARDRVAEAKRVTEQNYGGEAKHRLLFALLAAEQVRVLRNRAAHDPAGSFSLATADELLRFAAGSIDTLYELVVDANKP